MATAWTTKDWITSPEVCAEGQVSELDTDLSTQAFLNIDSFQRRMFYLAAFSLAFSTNCHSKLLTRMIVRFTKHVLTSLWSTGRKMYQLQAVDTRQCFTIVMTCAIDWISVTAKPKSLLSLLASILYNYNSSSPDNITLSRLHITYLLYGLERGIQCEWPWSGHILYHYTQTGLSRLVWAWNICK